MKTEYREVEKLPVLKKSFKTEKGQGWISCIFTEHDDGKYYPPMSTNYKVVWHLKGCKP